jgi:hypothetical protein
MMIEKRCMQMGVLIPSRVVDGGCCVMQALVASSGTEDQPPLAVLDQKNETWDL